MASNHSSSEYTRIIKHIESKGIMPKTAPSLDRMKSALTFLFKKDSSLRLDPSHTIVVAGTNGKGSVCATLESIFLQQQKTVGIYTSPHLVSTTERIRVNGKQLSEQEFVECFNRIQEAAEIHNLSHFEILTLMASFEFFRPRYDGNSLDWKVFEVGLGGTWDATNAIPHETSVITHIGMDHENFLGNTIDQIAANKFGIVHQKNRVIHSKLPENSAVRLLAQTVAKNTQSHWTKAPSFELQTTSKNKIEPKYSVKTQWGTFELALAGHRGAENTVTALATMDALGMTPDPKKLDLTQVQWPGRMQRFDIPSAPCPVYFSGDHNPSGMQSLCSLLKDYQRDHLWILCGFGKDKQKQAMISSLQAIPNSTIILTSPGFKGCEESDYEFWIQSGLKYIKAPKDALQLLSQNAKKEDLILVTGSLYLVGDLMKEIRLSPQTQP